MEASGIITLTTDFGLRDEFAGVMKGVILSVHREARIVDLSHEIPAQDLRQAALVVQAAFPFFPAGTAHVAVVDPGVGTSRKILALEAAGHLFLAPDNGVLTPLLDDPRLAAVREVSCRDLCLQPVSDTFHGRDILAPVAAHLSRGLPLEKVGPALDPRLPVRLVLPRPIFSTGPDTLRGEVVAVDRFGNLLTNLDREACLRLCGSASPAELRIKIRDLPVPGLRSSYRSVALGEMVAVIGSRNYLEIAVNQGNAAALFGLGIGEPVTVQGPSPPDGCGSWPKSFGTYPCRKNQSHI